MKVLIVENFWLGGKRLRLYETLLLNTFSILPSLFARQIAAITPTKHTVTLVNERYASINFNEKYDLVLINFNFSSAPRAFAIADAFTKKGVTVVLSGWYPSIFPDEAKLHADSVLIGKNETCWLDLLDDVEHSKLKPFYGPKKFDASVEIPPTNVKLPGFMMTGAVEATRGCPNQCDFCPETHIPGCSQFYARPVDEVIDEIAHLPQKFIMFYDNSLTTNPVYTKILFTKMKGLHKKFFCNGNVNVLARDSELVRLSKEAGCIAWLIGFESVSQQALNAAGKTTNLVDDYARAVENIHHHNMIVIGSFMFGFDTDTPEVFNTTLRVINDLRIDIADFSILTPFPGTPLYQKLDTEGRILTNTWEYYNMGHVVFTPQLLTVEQLQYGVRWMYDRFYAPPYALRRTLRSLRWGISPFLVMLGRNMVSMISRRRVHTSEKVIKNEP